MANWPEADRLTEERSLLMSMGCPIDARRTRRDPPDSGDRRMHPSDRRGHADGVTCRIWRSDAVRQVGKCLSPHHSSGFLTVSGPG